MTKNPCKLVAICPTPSTIAEVRAGRARFYLITVALIAVAIGALAIGAADQASPPLGCSILRSVNRMSLA